MNLKAEIVGNVAVFECNGEPLLEVCGDLAKWSRDDIVAEGELQIVNKAQLTPEEERAAHYAGTKISLWGRNKAGYDPYDSAIS